MPGSRVTGMHVQLKQNRQILCNSIAAQNPMQFLCNQHMKPSGCLKQHHSDPAPLEVWLLGVSWDPLLPGEVLALCFLFLLPSPLAGLPPLGLLFLRGPELMVAGVCLPFCTQQRCKSENGRPVWFNAKFGTNWACAGLKFLSPLNSPCHRLS